VSARPVIVPHRMSHVSHPAKPHPTEMRDDGLDCAVGFWVVGSLILALTIVLIVNWFLPKEETIADKLMKGIFR